MSTPLTETETSYKSVLKDMRSANPEVLRETARDVFQEKIAGMNKDQISSSAGENNSGTAAVMDVFSESDRIPKFDYKELSVGRVLGRGTFCIVRECNFNPTSTGSLGSSSSRGSFLGRLAGGSTHSPAGNNSKNKARSSSGHRSVSSDRSLSAHPNRFQRRGKNRSRYVMKQLSPDLKDTNKISYLKGIVDLAFETRILSSLDHENIIKLEATSYCDPFSEGYFILLEKVNETLAKKIKGWMDLDRQCKGITGVFTGSKSKIQRLNSERIVAAYDLAVGMRYLHEHRVVFRDLKPDNVGFNYVGVLKIFDFGLAKVLDDRERTKDGLYKMTQKTGAVRYMSPENAQGKPYGLSTDVYSWSMILWFVLALEPPFALYTEPMIEERVCKRNYRPKLFKSWSPRISMLINQCWRENPFERPSFADVVEEMKMELVEVDPQLAEMVEQSGDLLQTPGIQE
ncbi:serine/threonine protein kinase [Nitzschia inconspicua]|uniref:Serine/threonine protein kinase n=1 Tax=Nitzschia inconspicua TaxID=303405 RepID=A0A9K3L6Y1_9STRA|nr:serine/threonine protein kinase [Nitzschia inconspicua]